MMWNSGKANLNVFFSARRRSNSLVAVMKWISLILLSGLMFERTQALVCYVASGHHSSIDEVMCSASSTASAHCVITKSIQYGIIDMNCVSFANDRPVTNRCIAQQGLITCWCTTDYCNSKELLPTQEVAESSSLSPDTVKTTTVAAATVKERWFCYTCVDCGASMGTLLECSLYYESKSCYFSTDPLGVAYRTCGTPKLDEIMLTTGCVSCEGYTFCKCDDSGCNQYPEFVEASTSEGTSTTASTTLPTTTTTIPLPTITSKTTNSSTVLQPWLCYTCSDCDGNAGTLEDCSKFSSSKSCLLMISPSGEVSRGCGLHLFDEELYLPNGCQNIQGTTICKCSENACNEYPELHSVASDEDASNETSTTSPSLWHCYICVDCGTSLGALHHCSGVSSCSLVLKEGKVKRTCGSPATDLIIPEKEGCREDKQGAVVCKCSTRKCNAYPNMTGLSAQKAASKTPPNFVKVLWAVFKPEALSGSSINGCNWLTLLTILILTAFCI